MATQTYQNGVTLSDAGEFNRFDTAAYCVLSSVAGTNTITATGPANYTYSASLPPVTFIPANTNTGATTINITPSGGVAGGAKNVFVNGVACIGGELLAGVPATLMYDGTQFQLVARAKAPTRQVFASGSAATYTTPTGARRIVVRMKGGGGGGSGSGTTGPNSGSTGSATVFNSIEAAGGSGGLTNAPGAGGTGGTGTASVRIKGAPGQQFSVSVASGTNCSILAGGGGGQGGGAAAYVGSGTGIAGAANSGGGGAGGSAGATIAFASVSSWYTPTGGGEGEYAELVIDNPAATYTYTVGGGGNGGGAGTSGAAGGAGGSGFIIVDEYY